MGSYDLLALLVVVAMPVAGVAVVGGIGALVVDALRRSPAAGGIGVLGTLAATANLFVARACDGSVNRPILAAFVGPDACRRSALVSIQLVLLLAVGTALAVRAAELRR